MAYLYYPAELPWKKKKTTQVGVWRLVLFKSYTYGNTIWGCPSLPVYCCHKKKKTTPVVTGAFKAVLVSSTPISITMCTDS